jgi:hypothetical protein
VPFQKNLSRHSIHPIYRQQQIQQHSSRPTEHKATALTMTDMTAELNALGYPVLEPATPVPSDIEISQQLCKEVGLLPIRDVAKQ